MTTEIEKNIIEQWKKELNDITELRMMTGEQRRKILSVLKFFETKCISYLRL